MSEQKRDIGRREFLQIGGSAVLGASAVRVTGARAEAPAPAPTAAGAPSFIIDSHNHWGGTDAWIEEMVRVYRAHNAMACTIGFMKDLEKMKEAAAAYPDVFILYGRVDLDDPNAVREVVTFRENGFVGMKFHSPQKDWDDMQYFQVYRLCEHLGLHMLFHTGISSRRDPADPTPKWGSPSRMRPMALDTLCRQFPSATIQGAHFGNPWYDEAAEAARWNPNLFFDISGSTLYKFIKLGKLDRMSEYLWWADWGDAGDNPHTLQGGPTAWEHIVFGADEGPAGLAGNIERYQMMMDVNKVPAADRDKIWGLTMARIHNIDPGSRRQGK